jgi:hypothetical protein
MGFRFRKSLKIGGVRFNLGNKGISSVSVGKKGNTLNLSNKGVKHTLGINGTGLSYSQLYKANNQSRPINEKKSLIGRFFRFIGRSILLIIKLFFLCFFILLGYSIYINL